MPFHIYIPNTYHTQWLDSQMQRWLKKKKVVEFRLYFEEGASGIW